ncbi:MAG TPA: VOC family protein [Stellaceae bacterium]|nr:VOC family protein [Stellaceae bacterium]
MTITGIDAVTFGVEDMAAATRFLEDWGVRRAANGVYRCADQSEVRIRPANAPDLPPALEAGSTLREIIWGVDNKRALDAIRRELSRDRDVRVERDGSLRTIDDAGMAIAFRLTKRIKLKAKPLEFNTPGAPRRIDKPTTYYVRATPQEISHVVIGVPDMGAAEAFYVKRLGFRVSDRYSGRAVFLRAAPSGNHHHLFLLNAADGRCHFNHIAFKVRDVHEVIGGGQFVAARGWESQAGPGRHYVSSACFWYFKSPLGGAAEYAADEDIVTPKWRARTHQLTPEIFSEWTFNVPVDKRLAGAPVASSRSVP